MGEVRGEVRGGVMADLVCLDWCMKFSYSEFDGQGFLNPDQLFPQPQVMNFILQYGEQALDAMQNLKDGDDKEYVQALIDAGLLEEYKDEDGNTKLRMTGRMVRGFQHRALLEIFADMRKGSREGHQTRDPGDHRARRRGPRPTNLAIRSVSWNWVRRCGTRSHGRAASGRRRHPGVGGGAVAVADQFE